MRLDRHGHAEIFGAVLQLPKFRRLIADAGKRRFDAVLSEGLDLISREQEHLTGFYDQLFSLGIALVTVAEGTTAILLTGAGDDLISIAGSAQIDSGEGHDIVTLTGRREEWQNQNVGTVQIYTLGALVVYLNNVEEVRFLH